MRTDEAASRLRHLQGARRAVRPIATIDVERWLEGLGGFNTIADPSTMGRASVMHVDDSRLRRAEWVSDWPGLPGFVRASGSAGRRYTHDLQPGWEYLRSEILTEMIRDLEALAECGVRRTVPTRR